MLGLVPSVLSQEIDWEERLKNDLFCVNAVNIHLSVHLFEYLSQANIVLKQLNIGSWKQSHMIAKRLQFSVAKILAKFQWGHPQWGLKMLMR